MGDYSRVVDRLKHLAQCGDIPAMRRRQLLQIADELCPEPFAPPHPMPEPFADGYYRRSGLRLRLKPSADHHDETGGVRALIQGPSS